MIPDRIEYLLMLARDERAENDALIDKQNELFAARALRLVQLEQMHAETGRILQEELKRFTRWLPKDYQYPPNQQRESLPGGSQPPHPTPTQGQQMPRVVKQGPVNG